MTNSKGKEGEVTVLPVVLHGVLVKIFSEAGAKRGKTVQQLVSDAIIEKADALYREDHPEDGGR